MIYDTQNLGIAPLRSRSKPADGQGLPPLQVHAAIPRLCTIKEVAAEAGVGSTTVHRVIHGGINVEQETHQKVISAIHRLNAKKLAVFLSADKGDLR